MKKVELLAPAGDIERLKISLLYGADAVYIGGSLYSLRANAINFTLDQIEEATTFAHNLGKKVYLTLNIIFHSDDFNGVKEYIEEVVKRKIDAFIVSDPLLINYIAKTYPQVEVHVSTQNTNTNIESVKFFKELGAKRVVLARELSLEEIKKFKDLGIQTEVFIQGAMCSCYSGRCALSSYFTKRDANRGGCSQVCRFLFQSSEGDFSIASKDNNLIRYIDKLIEAKVTSLKVEGRMRSLYYLATVMRAYRKIIDAYYDKTLNEKLIKEEEHVLDMVKNRATSDHFIKGYIDHNDQYYLTKRGEDTNQDYVGLVESYEKGKLLFFLKNNLKLDEEVILFGPGKDKYIFKVDNLKKEDGEVVQVANHPEDKYIIEISIPFKVTKYWMLKRK